MRYKYYQGTCGEIFDVNISNGYVEYLIETSFLQQLTLKLFRVTVADADI